MPTVRGRPSWTRRSTLLQTTDADVYHRGVLSVFVRGLALISALVLAACQTAEPGSFSYYEQRIGPLLVGSCARNPSGAGCHVGSEGGTSLGNLDVSSYDALMRREDVLAAYGPYPVGLLLLKVGQPVQVQVETFESDPARRFVSITTDIRHNNGQTVDIGSSGYAQLKQWIESGYRRSGIQHEELAQNLGSCRNEIGNAPGWDPSFAERYPDSFRRFVDEVQPVLVRSCAGSQCHGTPHVDLYLTCGESDEAQRWNFWVAVQHVTSPASTSGILRRPLSTYRGGVFHEGGNVFASVEDPDYQVIREWVEELVREHPDALLPPADISEGLRFFANRVQPTLVRKGCMAMNCHSPSMFHDLRLRGGSQGHFSRIATMRNYEFSRLMLAIDSPDPNESRIIAKNLYPAELLPGSPGHFHRGGALFEDFGASGGVLNGATPDDCEGFDADEGDLNEVPAYCILVRWHQIEREEAIAKGELFPESEVVRSVVWISRPTGVGDPRDFDTYRPGADLRLAPASYDPETEELSLGADTSLLAGCGLDPSSADLRGTAVSWDGSRIAFAARSSAREPLRLYWMESDGTGCERIPGIAPANDEEDGILTHDFDPAFAPDGRIIFASSRGYSDAAIVGRTGPTRTPAALQPNANLYIYDPLSGETPRQLTFLLNQEIQPSIMTDGRLIFSAEKREPEFHMLAGRRQNLDGGDYHPLFAQRESVGYRSATEIMEHLDRTFVLVAAPIDAADGAGTIALINRSIGPDQATPRPEGDRAYIRSQRFPHPGAFGGGRGVFRSPSPLPSGRLLVSCDRSATDLTSGGYDFDLCELDPDSGVLRDIGGTPGRADIEAVAIFARAPREVFVSRIDEVNGNTRIEPGRRDAEVEVLDFPMLATLLFTNTREGRPIDPEIGGFDVFAHAPPPPGVTSFQELGADVIQDEFGPLYVRRELLGHVPLNPDGSASFRVVGGQPIILRVTDWSGSPMSFAGGAPFSGEQIQREQLQFYPGERARQSFRRTLFNPMCGGCHGSITNRELDIAAHVDVLTRASEVHAVEQDPIDLR